MHVACSGGSSCCACPYRLRQLTEAPRPQGWGFHVSVCVERTRVHVSVCIGSSEKPAPAGSGRITRSGALSRRAADCAKFDGHREAQMTNRCARGNPIATSVAPARGVSHRRAGQVKSIAAEAETQRCVGPCAIPPWSKPTNRRKLASVACDRDNDIRPGRLQRSETPPPVQASAVQWSQMKRIGPRTAWTLRFAKCELLFRHPSQGDEICRLFVCRRFDSHAVDCW